MMAKSKRVKANVDIVLRRDDMRELMEDLLKTDAVLLHKVRQIMFHKAFMKEMAGVLNAYIKDPENMKGIERLKAAYIAAGNLPIR